MLLHPEDGEDRPVVAVSGQQRERALRRPGHGVAHRGGPLQTGAILPTKTLVRVGGGSGSGPGLVSVRVRVSIMARVRVRGQGLR